MKNNLFAIFLLGASTQGGGKRERSDKNLRIGQVNKPYIGLIQENSIENSVQNCLP